MLLSLAFAVPAAAAPARLTASFDAPLGGPRVMTGAPASVEFAPMAPGLSAPSLSLLAPSAPILPAPVLAAPAALRPVTPAAAADKPKKPAAPAIAAKRLAASDLKRVEAKLGAAFDGAGHVDATEEYHSLWNGPPGATLREAEHPELSELRNYKVLLVPGFMTGLYVRLGNRADWPARRYFGDQLDWLKKMDVEHEVAAVHSLQSVEHNAPIIAKAIESSEKPVIVITHSMGGRILLHALITRPELRARVRGWTPMQTPFLGSHVADLPALVGISNLLRLFGGTKESVRSMRGYRSLRYYELHREAIEEILLVVPVVAFASWVNTSAPAWLALANPVLKWAWNAVSRSGGKNDILVPVKNAALPGMPLVVVHGVDHASAVVDTPASVDRVRILKTLLTMVLRRSPPAP